MPCALSTASFPCFRLVPPRQRKRFPNNRLEEILQVRVVSSRNPRDPPGVQRKMSNFPLGPRRAKALPPN